MALIGKAIGDAFTERVGMVLCFSGIVWLICGWQIVKRPSFPLANLLLMIPFPYVIDRRIDRDVRRLSRQSAG